MTSHVTNDERWMARAVELAKRGEGFVEPNPMVGCVIVAKHEPGNTTEVVGEGWHHAFGGPHAEVEAIRAARQSGKSTVGATAYVTLEPCCHFGKTPPCTLAIIEAGIKRVVIAMRDPFGKVDGGGITQLREQGIEVVVGCLEAEARELNSPYLTRIEKQRPWVIAKWAMTLDGKIASRTGASYWVSSDASRDVVQRLRARSDAIMVGSRTAAIDDPQLTVRLPNENSERLQMPHRMPLRVVFDSAASLPVTSRLAQTARDVGVLIAVDSVLLKCDMPECHASEHNTSTRKNAERLAECGCEILSLCGTDYRERMCALLCHLAERGVTNLLVEGGGTLLGLLFDLALIDEVHVFIAPKLVGGSGAATPIGGIGLANMTEAIPLQRPIIELVGTDMYCHGRVIRS